MTVHTGEFMGKRMKGARPLDPVPGWSYAVRRDREPDLSDGDVRVAKILFFAGVSIVVPLFILGFILKGLWTSVPLLVAIVFLLIAIALIKFRPWQGQVQTAQLDLFNESDYLQFSWMRGKGRSSARWWLDETSLMLLPGQWTDELQANHAGWLDFATDLDPLQVELASHELVDLMKEVVEPVSPMARLRRKHD